MKITFTHFYSMLIIRAEVHDGIVCCHHSPRVAWRLLETRRCRLWVHGWRRRISSGMIKTQNIVNLHKQSECGSPADNMLCFNIMFQHYELHKSPNQRDMEWREQYEAFCQELPVRLCVLKMQMALQARDHNCFNWVFSFENSIFLSTDSIWNIQKIRVRATFVTILFSWFKNKSKSCMSNYIKMPPVPLNLF